MFCNKKLGANKIFTFVEKFNIYITIVKKINKFTYFNDFFARELIYKVQPINKDKNILIFSGDGRLITYSLKELISNDNIANNYKDEVCIILKTSSY